MRNALPAPLRGLAVVVALTATPACDSVPTAEESEVEAVAEAEVVVLPGPPYDIAAAWQMALEGRKVYVGPAPGAEDAFKRFLSGVWTPAGGAGSVAPGETTYYPNGSRSYHGIDGESPPWDPRSGFADERPEAARPAKRWSRASVERVPRWVVSDEPLFAAVLDVTGGVRVQRPTVDAEFLADGRLASLVDFLLPDSTVLWLVDPWSGHEATIVVPGNRVEKATGTGFAMVTGPRGIELLQNGPRRRSVRLEPHEARAVWRVGGDGRVTARGPPLMAPGELAGVLADGSLAMVRYLAATDDTLYSAAVSLRLVEDAPEPVWAESHLAYLRTRVPGGAPGIGRAQPLAGTPLPTAVVAGDAVWVAHADRPELVVLDRGGGVVMKIEWDVQTGGASPGAHRLAGTASNRVPASPGLIAGANGLIYVQRRPAGGWSGPVRDADWLVVRPSGELAARFGVPSHWRVLAFGDGTIAAAAANDEGLEEIRVHALTPEPVG